MIFVGVCTKNTITERTKVKYSVVEVKGPDHFNYRMFIPGNELTPGQKVEVSIKPLPYLREPSARALPSIQPNYDRVPE